MPRPNKFANIVPLDPTATRSRVKPPPSLSKLARSTFLEIVASNPSQFVPSDTQMLASYAEGCVLVHALAIKAGRDPAMVRPWERAVRGLAVLARSLRLSPLSRTNPRTLARQQARGQPSSALEKFLDEECGDDDDEG